MFGIPGFGAALGGALGGFGAGGLRSLSGLARGGLVGAMMPDASRPGPWGGWPAAAMGAVGGMLPPGGMQRPGTPPPQGPMYYQGGQGAFNQTPFQGQPGGPFGMPPPQYTTPGMPAGGGLDPWGAFGGPGSFAPPGTPPPQYGPGVGAPATPPPPGWFNEPQRMPPVPGEPTTGPSYDDYVRGGGGFGDMRWRTPGVPQTGWGHPGGGMMPPGQPGGMTNLADLLRQRNPYGWRPF